jgi:hypothetical protein
VPPRHVSVFDVLQNFVSLAEQVLKSCLHFYRSTFFWFALVLKATVTDTVEVLAWLVYRGFLKRVLSHHLIANATT